MGVMHLVVFCWCAVALWVLMFASDAIYMGAMMWLAIWMAGFWLIHVAIWGD